MSEIPSVDLHLQLQKSQFKIPVEVIKKNFKSIQKLVEKQSQTTNAQLKGMSAAEITRDQKLAILRKMIQTQELYQKKLAIRVEQHNELVSRLEARIAKFNELDAMKRKYDSLEANSLDRETLREEMAVWYREQINLLIAGYLVKTSTNSSVPSNTGVKLARRLKMDKLLDYDVILQGLHIYNEIKNNNNLQVLIDWCNENKKVLKKVREEAEVDDPTNSATSNSGSLDFETYFQNFIELIKKQHMYEALDIARKYLVGSVHEATTAPSADSGKTAEDEDENFKKIQSAAGLLLFNSINIDEVFKDFKHGSSSEGSKESPLAFYDPNRAAYSKISSNFKPYKDLLSPEKWETLADFFLYNYNLIYGIEQSCEFLVMLSIGISALKTRSCLGHDYQLKSPNVQPAEDKKRLLSKIMHLEKSGKETLTDDKEIGFDEFTQAAVDGRNIETSVHAHNNCPICSIELFQLSSLLPNSHQIKSNIFENPVKLPNGNIYNLEKLLKLDEKGKTIPEYLMFQAEDVNQILKKRRVDGDEEEEDEDNADSYSYGTDGDSIDFGNDDSNPGDVNMDDDEDDHEDGGIANSSVTGPARDVRESACLKLYTRIKDPITGEFFGRDELVRVYPT
ncbi:unnamed protein product [Kuraishia capsulata CBS 1993]|uniref:RING-Gid-type domain-containing protein n=1 Tax=Kuraishia capsulata CBS 1993 TaxID=1382522 RepID=W6MFY4_9ASCO|nr:uncharacterized protein KUCA_T00000537001 [Kuraishia capsulata CBS 1993]CDK24571.1 unnamed protein product [Kuraishia capsulata CBS 1993]